MCLSNELHRKHETRKFVFTEILEFETPLTREGLASPSIRCSLQRGMEKPSVVDTSVPRAASKTSHRAYIFLVRGEGPFPAATRAAARVHCLLMFFKLAKDIELDAVSP